jgi:hypothetical protein
MQKLRTPPQKNSLISPPNVSLKGEFRNFVRGAILFFGNSGPHANIQKHRSTPSGRNVTEPEERRRRENNAINSGH